MRIGSWIIGLLLLCSPLQAANLRLNDRDLAQYAKKLQQQGEYYRAISEYKRLLHYFPRSPLAKKARLGIAIALRQGGEIEGAITYLEKLEPKYRSEEARLLLGLCYLDFQTGHPFATRQDQRTKGLELFAQSNHLSAKEFALEAGHEPSPPPYSPSLAAGLSTILPGAGSAYLGRWKEALYAGFFTLSFGWASYEASQRDRPDLSLGFGIFAAAFYGGSIYTAANGAHKLNDQAQQKAFDELRGKHGIWFSPQGIFIERRF